MSIVQTYHTMMKRLQTIVSHERITRIRGLAWLQSGILHSRSVHLHRIASKLPGLAKKLSWLRQLERLLDNQHIRVREWYHPMAIGLLQAAGHQLTDLSPHAPSLFTWHASSNRAYLLGVAHLSAGGIVLVIGMV